jgi:hypothetical protein
VKSEACSLSDSEKKTIEHFSGRIDGKNLLFFAPQLNMSFQETFNFFTYGVKKILINGFRRSSFNTAKIKKQNAVVMSHRGRIFADVILAKKLLKSIFIQNIVVTPASKETSSCQSGGGEGKRQTFAFTALIFLGKGFYLQNIALGCQLFKTANAVGEKTLGCIKGRY